VNHDIQVLAQQFPSPSTGGGTGERVGGEGKELDVFTLVATLRRQHELTNWRSAFKRVRDEVFGDTERRGSVDGNVLPAELRAAADHPLRDDVAFVRAILDSLPANDSVDTRRINT
jgi:hypothetical protein